MVYLRCRVFYFEFKRVSSFLMLLDCMYRVVCQVDSQEDSIDDVASGDDTKNDEDSEVRPALCGAKII